MEWHHDPMLGIAFLTIKDNVKVACIIDTELPWPPQLEVPPMQVAIEQLSVENLFRRFVQNPLSNIFYIGDAPFNTPVFYKAALGAGIQQGPVSVSVHAERPSAVVAGPLKKVFVMGMDSRKCPSPPPPADPPVPLLLGIRAEIYSPKKHELKCFMGREFLAIEYRDHGFFVGRGNSQKLATVLLAEGRAECPPILGAFIAVNETPPTPCRIKVDRHGEHVLVLITHADECEMIAVSVPDAIKLGEVIAEKFVGTQPEKEQPE